MVDDRSPSAKALAVVSQITAISLSGALPLVIGYGLDSWLQTRPVLLMVGGLFGAIAAVYLMIQLVKRLEADAKSNKSSS
jgi:F0F1-type ATP synthase assembly protein I